MQAQQVQTERCTQLKHRDAESGGTGTIYDLFATTKWKLYLFFSMNFKGTQENGNNCTQPVLNQSDYFILVHWRDTVTCYTYINPLCANKCSS